MTVPLIFGRLLIAIAVSILLGGLVIWLLGGDVTAPTGALWYEAHVGSLNLSQAIVQRYLYAPLWSDFIVPQILLRPLWEALIILFMFFLVTGGLIVATSRRHVRRHPSQFS